MTPLNRFGRFTLSPLQPRTDVANVGGDAGHCFGIWLVIVAHDRVRAGPRSPQGATKEGSRSGAVPFVPQQNVEDLPMLIHRPGPIVLLSAAKDKHLLDVPPPAHLSSGICQDSPQTVT